MSRMYGVIFAGGEGSRLGGVRKAELLLGGRRLIDIVAEKLGADGGPLVVATGVEGRVAALPSGSLGVTDLPGECRGPLAGLAAAVTALEGVGVRAGLLVCSTVDSPFLPQDYAARLTRALGRNRSAYAVWRENFYPPQGAFRLEALAGLPSEVMAGTARGGIRALHERLGGVAVDWSKASDDPFANINHPADLLAAARRWRGMPER